MYCNNCGGVVTTGKHFMPASHQNITMQVIFFLEGEACSIGCWIREPRELSAYFFKKIIGDRIQVVVHDILHVFDQMAVVRHYVQGIYSQLDQNGRCLYISDGPIPLTTFYRKVSSLIGPPQRGWLKFDI